MNEYAHPELLVTTQWVSENLDNPIVKLVEVDVDTQAYQAGHIPGAVGFNWQTQLQDQVNRDILSRMDFEDLMGSYGISESDTIVLYGDNRNWFAAYGFWLCRIYGHADVRLMDGGRTKWLNEPGRVLTVQETRPRPVSYHSREINRDIRARVQEVLDLIHGHGGNLVDVRSPEEYTGAVVAPPGMSETAQRGGHIPGAVNIPWSRAVRPDGSFRSMEELRRIYLIEGGVNPSLPTVAYCRIGERSSHTWFVLSCLLGLENVKNYDGSWTEYGSMIGLPIERLAPETIQAGA